MKIIVTIIPSYLVTNSLFVLPNKSKQESDFQQVGGLVTSNISTFGL